MSNIHTFRDLEAGQPRRSNPSSSFSTSSSSWGSTPSVSSPPSIYPGQGGYAVEQNGISMIVAPLHPDGSSPSSLERCCPRIALPTLTSALCFINTLLFLITLIVGSVSYDGAFVASNDLGGPSSETLLAMGGKYYPFIKHRNEAWRLFTPIFLHAGIIHLLSNLLFLMRIGYVLEARLGHYRFAALYLLAGVSASLWSCVLGSPTIVSVGASGAIFGLVGADLVYLAYNWVGVPHASQEAIFLGIATVVNLLMGMAPGIDNNAHLGGLISGLMLGLWLQVTLVKRAHEKWFKMVGAAAFWGMFLLFVLLLWAGNPWPGY